jgi:hypothetical protein
MVTCQNCRFSTCRHFFSKRTRTIIFRFGQFLNFEKNYFSSKYLSLFKENCGSLHPFNRSRLSADRGPDLTSSSFGGSERGSGQNALDPGRGPSRPGSHADFGRSEVAAVSFSLVSSQPLNRMTSATFCLSPPKICPGLDQMI